MRCFNDLGSSPVAASANRMIDAFGLRPGRVVQVADGVRAYIQALLMGIETWVRIPRDQLPPEYQHMIDPVFRLVRALYGHPHAGTSWEAWCADSLASKGFQQVIGWPNVFTHPQLQVIASVYVDDFKVSGLKKDVAEAWRLIGEVIEMEPPEELSKYLGCHHRRETMELDQQQASWRDLPLYGKDKKSTPRLRSPDKVTKVEC